MQYFETKARKKIKAFGSCADGPWDKRTTLQVLINLFQLHSICICDNNMLFTKKKVTLHAFGMHEIK
jgi:hypothetical protein